VAEDRSPARERPCDMTGSERRNERGREPLRDVEQDHRDPVARRERRQTFVPPMFPLPTVRMSTPRVARTTQYPNGRLPAR
jgi:hypothetical protein